MNKRTMKASASLYRLLLKEFPDLDTMEFPSIDRRDWPSEYKISYFYAELLWKMEEWGQCGPAFDQVVEGNPTVSLRAMPRTPPCSVTTIFISSSTVPASVK